MGGPHRHLWALCDCCERWTWVCPAGLPILPLLLEGTVPCSGTEPGHAKTCETWHRGGGQAWGQGTARAWGQGSCQACSGPIFYPHAQAACQRHPFLPIHCRGSGLHRPSPTGHQRCQTLLRQLALETRQGLVVQTS